MAGFDVGGIYGGDLPAPLDGVPDGPAIDRRQAIARFKAFITNYRVSDQRDKIDRPIYSDNLLRDVNKLEVDLAHLMVADRWLAEQLENQPTEYLPLFEAAAREVVKEHRVFNEDGTEPTAEEVQVLIYSSSRFGPHSLRDLTSARVGKLVMVPGIITSAAKPRHKATAITLQCSNCKMTLEVSCKPGHGGAFVPRRCPNSAATNPGMASNECPLDSLAPLPERSQYVDQQSLKLQECPEDVPTGELPRTLHMLADRQLVSRVTPGTRVTVVGIYSTFKGRVEKGSSALQQPYLRVVGMREAAGESHNKDQFSNEEITAFQEFAKRPDVLAEIQRRVAPNIFGSEDIKKAVACLLFGGSRKIMPDGTTRRGDVNVLLLGDPSTAKSQFLKYASKVAPIAVYTSGKGSSAAGLTATVVQDASSREFYLEGGAMVLADNGVCCIDEFDKMRPEDRVAIHEAMEQQTISIAKAGITTMLKSRTSVLAAANPPSGRYDDLKSAHENIELQSTILSRFDLIFIVKDDRSEARDKQIAAHVLEVHRTAGRVKQQMEQTDQEEQFLKRYIQYARNHCFARLSEEAQQTLISEYVRMRDVAKQVMEQEESGAPPVPITVRQLEAIVRISESLARMGLQTVAGAAHVQQALELFQVSTMNAVNAGLTSDLGLSEDMRSRVERMASKIRQRVHINGHILVTRLVGELAALGEEESLVMRALVHMNQLGELQYRSERKVVHRVR